MSGIVKPTRPLSPSETQDEDRAQGKDKKRGELKESLRRWRNYLKCSQVM